MSGPQMRIDQRVIDAMCRRSLAFFASEKLIGDPEPPFSGRFVVAHHHQEWSDLICNNDRVCIEAARGHGKSHFFTLALPLWDAFRVKSAGLDPPDCVIFSASQRQAQRLLKKVQIQVETNPKLAHLLPGEQERRQWSAQGLRLANGYTIVASGYGTKVRGGHPRLIVVDDGFNDNTAYSELIRQKEIDYFFQAIRPMLIPGGKIAVVGTPLHRQDLYARLEKNAQYVFRRFPAIVEDGPREGQPLWPELYSMENLRSIEDEVKSIRFTREYLCCAGGTFIETTSGPKVIESVAVGDVVLTHKGRWRPVTEVMQRRHCGELVRPKGTLRVTPNHPLWTPDGWVPAGQAGSGDSVTFPRPCAVDEPQQQLSLVASTDIPYLLTADRRRAYARGSARHLPSGSVGCGGAKSVPCEVTANPDLLYLLGLWLAEGFVGNNDRVLTFCFGLHEEHTLVAEAVRILTEQFGVTPRVICKERGPGGTGGTALVLVNSRILANWLARMFGRGSARKRLPPQLRDLDPALLWHLILGYADGDGWVAAGNTVRLSSVSQGLLQDMRFCLARCGLFSTLTMQDTGGASEICGRAVMTRPSWRLSISGGAARAFKARELPQRSYAWGALHMVKTEAFEGTVYNIEVEEDHSYVADGVAVHNCCPVADGSSLFPRRLFEGEGVEQPDVRLGMPLEFWQRLGIQMTAIGVDFGLSSSVDSDFTVVWTMGIDREGNRWIMDIYRERGLEYTEQKNLIIHAAQRYRADLVYVEANQAQRIFGDELRNSTDLPIQQHFTGENKHSQVKGLPALRVLLENRKYRLPLGDQRSRDLIGAWIDEMQGVTVQMGKVVSVAEHDDLPMANWICERAFAETPFDFSFGEQPGDKEAFEELMRDIAGTGDPEDPRHLDDDAFVLGAQPAGRGRPPITNARLVDGLPGDIIRDTEPVKPAGRGYPYSAPTALELLNGGF